MLQSIFKPCADNNVYKIIQFDDGLDKYSSMPNYWNIIGTWKVKVKLCNTVNNIVIESISKCKK